MKNTKKLLLAVACILVITFISFGNTTAEHETSPKKAPQTAQEVYENYAHHTPKEVFFLGLKAVKFVQKVGVEKAIVEFNYYGEWTPGEKALHVQLASCNRDLFLAAAWGHSILEAKKLFTDYNDVNGKLVGFKLCNGVKRKGDFVLDQVNYWINAAEPIRQLIFNFSVPGTDTHLQIHLPTLPGKYTPEQINAKLDSWEKELNKDWEMHQKGQL